MTQMAAPQEQTPQGRLRVHIEPIHIEPIRTEPVRAEHAASCAVVHVHGEIDAFTADLLRQKALSATAPLTRPRIVLDLDQVSFCDSAGLNALVAIWKAARSRRGDLVVARPPEVCRRILARTGLDQHIGVSPTVRHALQRIASQ